ncbi:MAG: tyrosine--tRNA ligase [Buchnera aphidicola (Nurudea yanoniella)]
MNQINLIHELKKRSLIAQITNESKLISIMLKKNISLYCGFDVTAESLHVGHILPLLCLKRFQNVGNQPFVLIGDATSLVGDPSFKMSERKLNSIDLVEKWKINISNQISLFLDFFCKKNNAVIINNYTWFKSVSLLQFLCNIGKYFSVNKMITRDAVKKRISRIDTGISFTEFSYNLLQAYDFSILYKKYNVILQLGGSDQWGNIVSGIDLIHKLYKKEAFGLTLPLLTQRSGIKFGKTEKNTIWLDRKKTSPYVFYQYWINISDSDTCKFLKFFTNLNILDINEIECRCEKIELNKFKLFLADYITEIVHGKQGVQAAKRISSCLFYGDLCKMKESDFLQLKQDGVPTINMSRILDLQQVLVDSCLATSRTQAKNMILSNSISINRIKQRNVMYILSNNDIFFKKYTLISRGKKTFCLICWIK